MLVIVTAEKKRIGCYGRLGWMDVNVSYSITFFIRSTTTLINVYQSNDETQLIAARVVINAKESWFPQKLTASSSSKLSDGRIYKILTIYLERTKSLFWMSLLSLQSCKLGMAIEVGIPCWFIGIEISEYKIRVNRRPSSFIDTHHKRYLFIELCPWIISLNTKR